MTANLLLADDMHGTRPKCWNRAPAAAGRWVRNGYCPTTLRVRLRWSPRWFDDVCRTWDGVGIGAPTAAYPTGTPYPIAHRWDCSGCRLLPKDITA